jgi:hypothetical protein
MFTYTLRYYAPAFNAEDHATILSLLSAIQRTRGVSYEVVEIPTRPGPFPSHLVTDESRSRPVIDIRLSVGKELGADARLFGKRNAR